MAREATKKACLFVMAAVVALLVLRGESPAVPVSDAPDAVTYVYEKDNGAPPAPVLAALNKLNRDTTRSPRIVATTFEVDTRDGKGEIPDQYKTPHAAATEAGLPAVVVTAGDTVLNTVHGPTTETQVLEAVR